MELKWKRKIKFAIICPTAKEFRVVGKKKASSRMKIIRFSMLSAIQVAASFPKDVEVDIIDVVGRREK